MQQPVITRVRAPSDLSQISMAIVIGNQVFGVPAIELSGAFGFQPLDQGLTDIAGLAVTDGNFIVGNGTNWVAESGATARTSLGLGTAATQNTGTSGANVPLLNGTNTWSGVQTLSAIPDLTSGGIKFPATQVPSADANTLDDYEEGTWTPAVTLATPGNLSVAYTSRSGRYVKIGQMVFFNCLLQTSTWTHTTASGFFNITGFPFTMGSQFVGAGTLLMSGWTKANYTSLGFETSNSTFMYALASGSAQALAELVAADLPTGGVVRIYGAGQYTV